MIQIIVLLILGAYLAHRADLAMDRGKDNVALVYMSGTLLCVVGALL